MSQSFHYTLMAVQAMIQKKLLASLKDTGLTAGQPKILDYLQEHNGANQTEIARACHIEAGSLTSVLNRMESSGLVERRTLNDNRRTFYIFLTDRGKELSDAVVDSFRHLEDTVFTDIPETDREQFMNTFLRICENLMQKED